MLINEPVIIAGNVAIVQSQDSKCLEISGINVRELPNLNVTITLAVIPSRSIVEGQYSTIKMLFGSWVESGDEDNHLEELYKSRLIPSSSPNE